MAPDPSSSDGRGQRSLRFALRAAAVVAAVLVLLVAATLLLLQFPGPSRFAATSLLRAIRPVPGATVALHDLRGNWITSMDLFGVEVARDGVPPTGPHPPLLAADTLRIRYSPLDLLRRRVVIHRLELRGGFLALEPRDISSRRPSGPARPLAEWLTGRFYTGTPLRIRHVSLSRCGFATAGDSGGSRAEDLCLEARGVALGGGPAAIDLDTLGLRFLAPGTPDHWWTLGASGSLGPGWLKLDTLSLASDSTRLDARGALALSDAPRDTVTGAEFTLDARPLDLTDLSFFLPGTPASGQVEGKLSLRGAHVSSLEGTLRASTRGAWVSGVALGASAVDVKLAGGRVDFEASGRVANSPIEVHGWLSRFGRDPDGEVELRVPALPPALPGLPDWDPRAARSACLRATIERGVARVNLDVSAGIERIALAGALDLTRAPRFTMRGGRLARFDERGVEAPGGSLTFDSLVLVPGTPPTLRLEGGHIGGADLAAWSGRLDLGSEIDARVEGEWRFGAQPAGNARLAIKRSRFRGQAIDAGALDLRLANGDATLAGNLDAPSGRVSLDARGRPFDRDPRYTIRLARFEQLDLAAWTGAAALASNLDGSLALDATLRGAGQGKVSGTLDLRRSTLRGIAIEGGRVRASLDGDRWSTDTALDLEPGPVVVHATRGPEGLTANAEAPLELLARLLGVDSLAASGTARVALDLNGDDLRTARGTGRLAAAGRLGDATLDTLWTTFRARAGVVDVDSVVVRSNALTAWGGGRLALFDTAGAVSAFRINADVTDAQALATIAGVDSLALRAGHAELHLTGTARARALDGALALAALATKEFSVQQIDVRGTGTLDPSFRPTRVDATARLERVDAGGVRLRDGVATLSGRADSLAFRGEARASSSRAFRVRGTVLGDSALRRVEITEATYEARDQTWRLAQPGRFALAPDRLTVESFEARSDTGAFSVRGTLARSGTEDFTVELRGMSIAGLAEWIGRRDELRGRVDGRLRLEGSAERPRASGELTASLRAVGGGGGDARARLDWRDERLELDASYAPLGSPPVTLSAHLPLALSLAAGTAAVVEREGEVAFRLVGSDVSLPALAPLFDPLAVAPRAGTLDLDLALAGTSGDLEGSGGARLTGGELELPGLGVTYTGMGLGAELKGHRLEVLEARASSEPGTIEGRGEIVFHRLTEVVYNLDVEARRFQAMRTRDQSAIVSGKIELTGTVGAPVVRGTVDLDETDIYLTPRQATGSAVELTEDDLLMLEANFGDVTAKAPGAAKTLYDAARLEVEVNLGGRVWVRQRVAPRLAVKLDGGFKLVKEPHGEPLLTGRIAPTPRRGFVEQFARQFDFAEGGEVKLNGALKDHDIDLKAIYKIEDRDESGESQVVVRLDIQGRIDQLKLILSSDPPMDQTEIVDYIITGQSSRSAPDQSMGAEDLATQMVLSRATSGIEDYAQRAIGLDVVQVRQDGLQGTTLIAGRYVNPQLYLGFRQPVSSEESGNQTTGTTNHTQYELEYSTYRWLTLNLQGETSWFKSFFHTRYAY
jgi:autotransporter translocation and assembly factor TamB